MNARVCHREDELLDALGRGFVGPELTSHVAACAACGELRLVAGALLDEQREAVTEAPVPSARTMWWRMQMRHRQETQARARRSLLIGQAMTLTIAVMVVGTLFGTSVAAEMRHVADTIKLSAPLLLALTVWLLLAPLAGWVAIRQK
jgi:predicted anti-sigma-YlaC factor YlaD